MYNFISPFIMVAKLFLENMPALLESARTTSKLEKQRYFLKNIDFHTNLARNLNLFPEIQQQLAEVGNKNIWFHLVNNPVLVPTVQDWLFENVDFIRQLQLISNPKLHSDLQRRIAASDNDLFKIRLLTNYYLLPELLPDLFQKYYQQFKPLIGFGFKYQNPQTQELLEKYLLLI